MALIDLIKFGTSDIADALSQMGVNCYLEDIQSFGSHSSKIIGEAHTVEFVSKDDLSSNPIVHHVDSAPANSIIVIKTPKNSKNAVWGGLMTTRSKFIGVQGVIIDGNYRDSQEINELQFPVWAKSKSCLAAKPFLKLASIQQNIVIGEQYPVTISNSDYIMADSDGCVCIPKHLLMTVIERCKIAASIDEKCKLALENGESIQETFSKYRS